VFKSVKVVGVHRTVDNVQNNRFLLNVKDSGVDGRIILKWIFERLGGAGGGGGV
jgi:hypothetical protein